MDRILRTISPGTVLTTPSGLATFEVEEVDLEAVMIRAGAGRWPIRIPADCWGDPEFPR